MAKYTLPKPNYDELVKAERDLHDILPEFDKLEECGVDCQEMRNVREEALKRSAAIKKHYAPGK